MRITTGIVLLLVLAVFLLPAVAAACPDCKDAKSDSDTPGGSANLGRGFYWSILLMMAAPFAVVASVGVLVVKSRRARGARL